VAASFPQASGEKKGQRGQEETPRPLAQVALVPLDQKASVVPVALGEIPPLVPSLEVLGVVEGVV
jgi:hypothetical protein